MNERTTTDQSSDVEVGAQQAEALDERPTTAPLTDVFETKDAFILMLDMPRADPASLDVSLDRHLITVAARATPIAPPGYTLIHAEYREGDYEREFAVTEEIDADRVEAVFNDGVLRLTLPKTPESRVKKIAVKSA